MNLNLNSQTAKMYRWFYATGSMPNTLCPYFWKLVIMWIFIVPYSILSIPYLFMNYFTDKDWSNKGTSIIEKPFAGGLLWVMVFLVGAMLFSISLFWVVFPEESFLFIVQLFGTIMWLAAFGYGIYFVTGWAFEKYKNSKIKYDADGYRIWDEPKKQDSVVIHFIKATYNKYCPKIDWR